MSIHLPHRHHDTPIPDDARAKLAKISALHTRREYKGDYNNEIYCPACEEVWPCETARIILDGGSAGACADLEPA